MAGIIASAITSPLALSISTAVYPINLVAPANQRVKILRWSVMFDEETGDATPAIPITVDVGKGTLVTGTSALTANKVTAGSETLQTSVLQNGTGITTFSALDRSIVNPQTSYEVIFPMGQELIIQGGEEFIMRVTPGGVISTNGLNVKAKVWFEE